MFGRTYGTYGCNGGWMNKHWEFLADHGAMLNDDYSYTARDEPCKHDYNKTIGKAAGWSWVDSKGQMLDVVAQ